MAHVSPFGVRRVRASSDRPATPTRLRFPTRSMSLGLAGPLGFEASRLSVFMGVEPISRTKIEFVSDERFISLRRALGAGSFGINQLTLQPGQQRWRCSSKKRSSSSQRASWRALPRRSAGSSSTDRQRHALSLQSAVLASMSAETARHSMTGASGRGVRRRRSRSRPTSRT